MAKRNFTSNALIPHGHHQNWVLIEEVIRELERVTDQWQGAETEIAVVGKRSLYAQYDTLIDAKVDLGEDRRDITEVEVSRAERDGDESDMYASVTFSRNQKDTSSVFASGPVKRDCEGLVRTVQNFILQAIDHPDIARISPGRGSGIESRLQHLHSAVKSGALARLANGHGDEAVAEACNGVGERLRQLSGLRDDGASLVTNTFGGRRLIQINDGLSKTDASEQEGYMHLGLALFRAARNPRAHRPSDPNFDTDEVIEWLSVASALHRALDRAKVTHPVK